MVAARLWPQKGTMVLKQRHARARNKAMPSNIEGRSARQQSSTRRNCESGSPGTAIALSSHQRPLRRRVLEGEKVMNRKNTSHARSKVRLAVKKETLKDLSTKQPVL